LRRIGPESRRIGEIQPVCSSRDVACKFSGFATPIPGAMPSASERLPDQLSLHRLLFPFPRPRRYDVTLGSPACGSTSVHGLSLQRRALVLVLWQSTRHNVEQVSTAGAIIRAICRPASPCSAGQSFPRRLVIAFASVPLKYPTSPATVICRPDRSIPAQRLPARMNG